jgi:hypothetical protein
MMRLASPLGARGTTWTPAGIGWRPGLAWGLPVIGKPQGAVGQPRRPTQPKEPAMSRSRKAAHDAADTGSDVVDDVADATSNAADEATDAAGRMADEADETAGDLADEAAQAASDVADEVGDGAKQVADDVAGGDGSPADTSEFSSKLGELRTLLADLARSAPAAASGSFEDLKAKATEFCEACEGKVSDATKAVVQKVKERPGQTLMAAVGAGLLTWWLLSRSSGGSQHGGRKG